MLASAQCMRTCVVIGRNELVIINSCTHLDVDHIHSDLATSIAEKAAMHMKWLSTPDTTWLTPACIHVCMQSELQHHQQCCFICTSVYRGSCRCSIHTVCNITCMPLYMHL